MIRPAVTQDYAVLAELWEASVRATHDFLAEEDLAFYRERLVAEYFPQVRLWVCEECGGICGFIGISDMVEMLFVHPSRFGRGVGTALLSFAVDKCGMRRVDVNEQNHAALAFYLARGFKAVGRSATDGEGRPYPLLHLEIAARRT